MQRAKITVGIFAATATLLIVTGAAVSTISAAPADSGVPTLTTLPLLGVPLTVEVTTGPGGVLTNVSVNPADGFTAAKVKPNKVAFVNEDGTAKVVVRGRDGGQRVEVKAGALADISGDGGWSGDVFGTGTPTTVSFTIGATPEGGPDITGVGSSDPTAAIGATEYENGDGDDNESYQKASARVTFTNGGQSRSLSINVSLKIDEAGDSRAKVSVTLGKLRAVVQPVADAVGTRTWVGLLCDGTEASVTYAVNADGSLSDVFASPDTAVVTTDANKVSVRFSSNERVKIRSTIGTEGIKVSVKEKIRCRDAEDPTVNTPIATTSGEGNHHGDDHSDDNGDKHGDGDGHGDG